MKGQKMMIYILEKAHQLLLKGFLRFFADFWGILAGFSAFFADF
jgi:hypothetical protein